MNQRTVARCVALLIAPFCLVPSAFAACDDYPAQLRAASLTTVWAGDFARGMFSWGALTFQFGQENTGLLPDAEGRFNGLLRAHYKKGSYDPGSAQKGLAPLGGLQFTSRLSSVGVQSADRFVLSYAVKFREGFDFRRGGKLPGLYGGIPRSGGKIPSGSDGFSTRIVWQSLGKGALYAYLPSSVTYGTILGSGSWFFRPGRWMDVAHAVRLNTPGISDGEVAVWIDGSLVFKNCELRFRDVDSLKIDGVFFSTFFGGNDPSWATPVDTHVDFADFRLSRLSNGW